MLSGGAGSIDSGDSIADEKRRLKNLMRDDEHYLKKLNNADDLIYGGSPKRTRAMFDEYDTSRGLDQTNIEEKDNKENIQTTEFDDSADEATNVRLKEDSAQ